MKCIRARDVYRALPQGRGSTSPLLYDRRGRSFCPTQQHSNGHGGASSTHPMSCSLSLAVVNTFRYCQGKRAWSILSDTTYLCHITSYRPNSQQISQLPGIFLRYLPMRTLKSMLSFHRLHLHITILCLTSQSRLVTTQRSKSLISTFILLFEMHV